MKFKPSSPLFLLLTFIVLVSLACGSTPASPTTAPQAEQPTQTVEQAKPTELPTPMATAVPSGLVTNLTDLKKATIQIEAQGTFIDPQFGYMANAAGRGSGFIIDPSGIAVTNNHVVTGAALLKVWVGGDANKVYNARVLGVSECSDLAVIDIEGDGFPYLSWFDEAANVGLEVYAAGFPLGDPEFTMTKGIVSKEKADGETNWASVDSVLEHTATINPGNSGGPLVDVNGKVVGINYAGSSSTNQYFAIARGTALPVIDQLRAGKDVDSIGINGQAVSSEDGSIMGVWVSSVKSGSPADKTGVKAGDIVTSLENLYLASDGTLKDYCDILRTHTPEDTLAIQILRWDTQEILEGQLNGRTLAVASSFATQLGGEVNDGSSSGSSGGTTSGDYSSYVAVQDDSGQVQLEVPAEWSAIDGSIWSSDWGGVTFEAPSVTASSDLDAYYNSYSTPGVFFAASKGLGNIGGYVELLDGVKGWYENDCTFSQRIDYGEGDWSDPWYEGKFDVWENCGPDNTMVIILAARPKTNPEAYLLLLEVKIISDADLNALSHILETFQANF